MIRTSYTVKGQLKCFHCRMKVRSKDGAWCETQSQQVFLCKPCDAIRSVDAKKKADSVKRP